MRSAAIVDPRFAQRLCELRHQRGLSLRELARLAYYGKSYLHDLESGRRGPSVEAAQRIDDVLEAGGALAGMVVAAPAMTVTDDEQRVEHVLTNPSRLDAATVRALAAILAAQRRIDEVVPATALLPWAEQQWRTVADLARQAGGRHAADLRTVVAEWTQFIGWLQAEARHDAGAVRTLAEAAAQADALDDGVLGAQVENFRGYLERQRGNPRGIVRHFLAAYHTPGATALQRVGDAVQAAHGFALLGDVSSARRLLGEASELTTAAEDEAPPAAAYWLSSTFSRLGIGLAHLELGDRAEAAQHLRAGLDGLPPDQREAEWTGEYRAALARSVQ